MYVSVGQAARALGVTPDTVRRWTTTGLLACVRTAGGHRRIAREDVDELKRAIGHTSHIEARRARERETETLVQASIDLASILDQQELLATIARHVTQVCDCSSCAISAYDAEKNVVRALAEYDAMGRQLADLGEFDLAAYPLTKRVIDEQVPMLVNADDRGADPAEVALLKRLDDASSLMLPLVFRDQTIGLLEAVDAERSRRYSSQELRLVRALAGQAAVAMRNADLFQTASHEQEATASVEERLAAFATGLRTLGDLRDRADAAAALAELACTVFDARSCVIAREGRPIGAALVPAQDGPQGGEEAHVLNGDCLLGDARYELTVALEHGARRGDAELLEVIVTLVAQLA